MPYPHKFIRLTDEERKQVEFWINEYRRRGQNKKVRRLQILLRSDHGLTFKGIASELNCPYITVRWNIYQYLKKGLKPFIPAPHLLVGESSSG